MGDWFDGRSVGSDAGQVEPSILLSAGRLEVGICPQFGGSLSFFRTNAGVEILKNARHAGDAAASACFPMVPFCNRVRGRGFVWGGSEHLLEPNTRDGLQTAHGFGWRSGWDVISLTRDSARLRHRHSADAWPWDYVADQWIRLHAYGLAIELSVTNESRHAMPAGLGLHPYFPLTVGSRVGFSAGVIQALDAAGFPTRDRGATAILREAAEGRLDPHVGSRYIGGVLGDVRIGDPNGGHVVVLRESGCPQLALHVEKTNGLFCLEPMSHAVGALNDPVPSGRGIRLLQPGERFGFDFGLNVEHAG